MITSLHISNYALISQLDIDFTAGLNIITGETGSGKSIILGALSLLLGGRADMKAVRDPSRKSVIEAQFRVTGYERLHNVLSANDIDPDPDVCILRRELTASARSRAFINDTPVTLPVLREVAMQLVDIHSQHQNLLLCRPDYQLSIIDSLACTAPLLERYIKAYDTYRAALRKYTATRDMIKRNRADAEYLSFQLERLKEMNLRPGEQQELEQQRDMLANMSVIKENLTTALQALNGAEPAALSLLDRAADALRRLSDVLPDADHIGERLRSAQIELADIADSLASYDADLNADPGLLDSIDERLSKIYSLETVHHVDDSDGLIALRESMAAKLSAIENADSTLEELTVRAKTAKRAASALAAELTKSRAEQAEIFAAELKARAMPLGMKNLRCEILLTQGKLTATGADTADFRFAFNKNQALMPVSETASGGEISRLILVIKSIVSEKMQLPTIIFDEVDTGVSGEVALLMARLMKHIAAVSQVIAITHLPQVAAMGDTHFRVYKEDDDTSTNTLITRLSSAERQQEIALMLSGSATNASALDTAAALLDQK